mgnify:CR=1 FL=1|jgi:hypothetical protein
MEVFHHRFHHFFFVLVHCLACKMALKLVQDLHFLRGQLRLQLSTAVIFNFIKPSPLIIHFSQVKSPVKQICYFPCGRKIVIPKGFLSLLHPLVILLWTHFNPLIQSLQALRALINSVIHIVFLKLNREHRCRTPRPIAE